MRHWTVYMQMRDVGRKRHGWGSAVQKGFALMLIRGRNGCAENKIVPLW